MSKVLPTVDKKDSVTLTDGRLLVATKNLIPQHLGSGLIAITLRSSFTRCIESHNVHVSYELTSHLFNETKGCIVMYFCIYSEFCR